MRSRFRSTSTNNKEEAGKGSEATEDENQTEAREGKVQQRKPDETPRTRKNTQAIEETPKTTKKGKKENESETEEFKDIFELIVSFTRLSKPQTNGILKFFQIIEKERMIWEEKARTLSKEIDQMNREIHQMIKELRNAKGETTDKEGKEDTMENLKKWIETRMKEMEDKITNAKIQTTKPKKSTDIQHPKETTNEEAIDPLDQNTQTENPPQGHEPWLTTKNKKKKSAQGNEKPKEQEQENKPNTERRTKQAREESETSDARNNREVQPKKTDFPTLQETIRREETRKNPLSKPESSLIQESRTHERS